MDEGLNAGFFVLHTLWIAFVCTGWGWRSTRLWHLAAVMLTAASWFGLGVWYGWGYCPCTDWHYAVRARLNLPSPPSYIQLLISTLTGIEMPVVLVNAAALLVLFGAALLGSWLSYRDLRRARAVQDTATKAAF